MCVSYAMRVSYAMCVSYAMRVSYVNGCKCGAPFVLRCTTYFHEDKDTGALFNTFTRAVCN